MIDSYSFGKMVIEGNSYRKDVIVLPDASIISPWWRASGHRLVVDDIEVILKKGADTLVIGTGSSGMMQTAPGLMRDLENRGVNVIIQTTDRAVQAFNEKFAGNEKVAGCFHLTC